jgi:hypothetical protein
MTRVAGFKYPRKLRVRASHVSGKPLARLRVELLLCRADKEAPGRKASGLSAAPALALRSLSTNRDGFAIFSLSELPADAAAGALAVRYAQSPELTFALDRDALGAGGNYMSHVLPDGPWLEAQPAEGPWLDDCIEPDDVWAIPGIFPDLGDLEFGDDYCGRLVPNDLTVRISSHDQLVRTRKNVITCLGDEAGMAHPHDAVAPGEGRDGAVPAKAGPRPIVLHEGELIRYEIKCARLGYTFGDLLYSLPLAPCESVTLAVSHWEQRQRARAEQTTESEESRSAAYYRQNALSEAMSAASNVSNQAKARMAGFSGGSGSSGEGMIYSWLVKCTTAFNVSVGASSSEAFSREQFASTSTRDFSDRIQQQSEAWRRDHQVVIMEQSESEDQQVSYRTVCNNNHCRVLNIFYHEVLNNYRVTTRMVGHREVYLVPYEVKPFDLHSALCARPFLLPFLIDQELEECYRKLRAAAPKPAAAAGGSAPVVVDEFKIDIKFGFITPGFSERDFRLVIKTKAGEQKEFPISVGENWQPGASYSYTIDTTNLDPRAIHEAGFVAFGGSGGWGGNHNSATVESFTVSVKDPVSAQWVSLSSGGPDSGSTAVMILAPAAWDPPSAASAPSAPDAAADQECAAALLAHLNCHATYYNSILWLLEDPNERICRFDHIVCGASGTSLSDLVIPEPVAVVGCSVAFLKAGSPYVPYDGPPIVDERLLTLSTPGIFADAALGKCSACETIVEGEYRDWTKTPCMCGAKDVTLRNPTDTALIQGGTSPFPGLATGVWAAGVTPPPGEKISSSLVDAFGGALASAMMKGADSAQEMAALQDLLGKMTQALKDLIPGGGVKPDDKKGEDKGGGDKEGGKK